MVLYASTETIRLIRDGEKLGRGCGGGIDQSVKVTSPVKVDQSKYGS